MLSKKEKRFSSTDKKLFFTVESTIYSFHDDGISQKKSFSQMFLPMFIHQGVKL